MDESRAMTKEDCLFCNFAAPDSSVPKVWENDLVYAINDISPQAPVHILLIPKKHYPNSTSLAAGQPEALVALFNAVDKLANEKQLTGFRTVFNTGADAGQSVFHAHLHLLGGREFSWPPG